MRKADCRFRCSETTETVMDGLSKLLMEVALNNVSIDARELDDISNMIRAIKILSADNSNKARGAEGETKDVHVTVIKQKFEGASCSPKLEIAAENPIAVCCSIETRGASCDPSITVK